MSSPEKQAANRANAQHSSGPRTSEGKARSAANSLTHAFCSKQILVATEEKEEFDTMSQGYDIELSPEGDLELTLWEEIVTAPWQLRRMRRMETEACSGHDSFTAILDDESLQKKLDRLARHKTRIERTFHRCLKQFKTIQNERFEQDTAFHSMQSLIAARAAQQNSERTQPAADPGGTGPQTATPGTSSEPLPTDYFENIAGEFDETIAAWPGWDASRLHLVPVTPSRPLLGPSSWGSPPLW